jgi:hypothetical protein
MRKEVRRAVGALVLKGMLSGCNPESMPVNHVLMKEVSNCVNTAVPGRIVTTNGSDTMSQEGYKITAREFVMGKNKYTVSVTNVSYLGQENGNKPELKISRHSGYDKSTYTYIDEGIDGEVDNAVYPGDGALRTRIRNEIADRGMREPEKEFDLRMRAVFFDRLPEIRQNYRRVIYDVINLCNLNGSSSF